MSFLDEPDRWKSIDSRFMHSLMESFPEQVEEAAQSGRDLSLALQGKARVLVVTGLGGSAIGGDIVRSVAGAQLRIPLVINRDYAMPGFVDSSCLVFACSYSGNTEETLSAYRQARQAKAQLVCITSGGQLESMAKADGVPVLRLPAGLPPRAALGHSLLALLAALQTVKVIPDLGESLQETIALLARLRTQYCVANLEVHNPAKRLARSLNGKIVAIYGSSAIMDAAAFRWRSQIAENAKNMAFHHVLPEMNHNELVGWLHPEDVLRRVGVVLLRDRGDHPQVQRRFDLTRGVITDRAGALCEVWSEGSSLLARVLSVIYLGDFVSLYLAYLNNVDPTPVQVIDSFNSKLGGAG
jgi:glucose/mannose-6-phosphate isomerase